jgi:spore coat protein U-like protein
MKKLILSLSIMALGISLTGAAYGGSVASILDISANVVVTCTVSTTAVNFGDYSGTQIDNLGSDVTVNCTSGTQYNIAMDAGQHLAGTTRRMADGLGNYLGYAIYGPDNNNWGDNDFANTYSLRPSVPGVGDGLDQSYTINARIFADQAVPIGAYTDVVNVTVHY